MTRLVEKSVRCCDGWCSASQTLLVPADERAWEVVCPHVQVHEGGAGRLEARRAGPSRQGEQERYCLAPSASHLRLCATEMGFCRDKE